MYLDNSVFFSRDLFLKEQLWLLKRSLKVFSQVPQQYPSAAAPTDALQTRHSERQSPSTGQPALRRQLQAPAADGAGFFTTSEPRGWRL